ncbi:hypothetical protein GQ43DRAFT_40939 [Delitschia confertaspora ATCC 74209]|uniref:Uncharacterized protein n=1 Tax=Delitschia confertaspora ATCC 74209 TaxID=1513339 RepID=A0A9P4JKW8_9PLEO|nr:hypothetical protein GQ43DRAFT_40939 [Delitschia confertaspora ATCC 74209]
MIGDRRAFSIWTMGVLEGRGLESSAEIEGKGEQGTRGKWEYESSPTTHLLPNPLYSSSYLLHIVAPDPLNVRLKSVTFPCSPPAFGVPFPCSPPALGVPFPYPCSSTLSFSFLISSSWCTSCFYWRRFSERRSQRPMEAVKVPMKVLQRVAIMKCYSVQSSASPNDSRLGD